LSERFLKWAVKRYYKSLGYDVRIGRIRLGNTEIDGEAVGLNGVRIAIEVKTPYDRRKLPLSMRSERRSKSFEKS